MSQIEHLIHFWMAKEKEDAAQVNLTLVSLYSST